MDHYQQNYDNDEGAVVLAAAEEDMLGAGNVLLILQQNPDLIRTSDPIGDTVLHVAARAGHLETVDRLISLLGCHESLKLKLKVLKGENGDGETALQVSVKNGHHQVASLLTKAEKEAVFCRGVAVATSRCLLQLVDIELAEVKRQLMKGETLSIAQHWACLCRAIKKGEDIFMIGTGLMRDGKKLFQYQDERTGETLLHKAVRAARHTAHPLYKLVKFLVANGLTNVALLANHYSDTALHIALQLGHVNEARWLVKMAPETVYNVNEKGVSPLYLAVRAGHHDLVEYMLLAVRESCAPACSADILPFSEKHATLAHHAIKKRSLGTLKMLMENQPKLINGMDVEGRRPLSFAARKSCLEEVTYLLTSFPDSVEKYDRDGSLPIHKAIGGGHVSIIQAFLTHCPRALYHVDKRGRSVLHIAVRYGNADILAYLTKDIRMDDPLLYLKDNEGKTFSDHVALKH